VKRLWIVIGLVLLLHTPVWAQTIWTSSPTLFGTSTPLVLNIAAFQQFNITLTANTQIKFNVPLIKDILSFRLKICENGVGGFMPTFTTVGANLQILNKVGATLQQTIPNYCETQSWTFNNALSQVTLENVSPPVGGLPGVTVSGTPVAAGLCLSSTGLTTANWGSCGSGNLPTTPATGQLLISSAGNPAWSAFVAGSDITLSGTSPGVATLSLGQQACTTNCTANSTQVTCAPSGIPITISLPSAAAGIQRNIKMDPSASGNCVIAAAGIDTIDGFPTLTLTTPKQAVQINGRATGVWQVMNFAYPVAQSLAASNFATNLSGGVLTGRQPNCSDLTGAAAHCGTNASELTSGTIGTAQLPNPLPASNLPTPTTSTLGGVKSTSVAAHMFLTALANTGIFTLAQPASTDLADLPVPISSGGTGHNAAGAATANAIGAAASGNNSDLTSITGLTTPLAISEGGTQCGAPVTVATLPGSPVQGETCQVTNASSCTAGTAPTDAGSGGTKCALTWCGTSWLPANCAVTAAVAGLTTAGTGLNASGSSNQVVNLITPVAAGNGGLGTATVPSSAQIPVGNGSNTAYAPQTVGGDATISNAGSLTVTKTNGTSFATSATTDTTNASNISSGTLGAARLPNPSASTLGGVQSKVSVSHQFLNTISTAGVPGAAQPASTDLSDTPIPLSSGGTQCGAATTVAGLPGSPTQGEICNVTDADTCTAGTACAHTSGSTKCQCTWNGTSWLPAGGATSAATGGVTAVNGSGIISSSGGTTPTISATNPVPVANGGTNATAAGATAANNIGALAEASNLSDVANATTARGNLSAAKSGANSDITSITGLSTPLAVNQGGSGSTSPALIQGSNVTITGSWPNQTINASGGTPQVPINQGPAQTGKYLANNQGMGNLACPTLANDVLVQACAASVTTATATTSMTTPFIQTNGSNPATSGLVRDVNATTTVYGRNAANTADVPEIGTNNSNNVTVGGAGATAIQFNNSSVVSNGSMLSGAFVDSPQVVTAWMGGTENCTNTGHDFTMAANSTLTFACPLDQKIHNLYYRFRQPQQGTVFTYQFSPTPNTPLGGPLPAPCTSNGCIDDYNITFDGVYGDVTVQFVRSVSPLNTTPASACPVGQTCKFFSSSGGSDSNNCSQGSPCQTISKAMTFLSSLNPGDQLLFKGGDTFSASGSNPTLTLGDIAAHAVSGSATLPIVIGSYGTGRAIFDELNTNAFCFIAGVGGSQPAFTVQYLTINNIECTHAFAEGVVFNASSAALPGITVTNMLVDNDGPFCSQTTGSCKPTAETPADWQATHAYSANSSSVYGIILPLTANAGNYWFKETVGSCTSNSSHPTWPQVVGNTVSDSTCSWTNIGANGTSFLNQLHFLDSSQSSSSVHFINNIVKYCGGHNCLEIQGDRGAPVISGNTVGPGCVHNCIDEHGVGNASTPIMITNNVSSCGYSLGLCGCQNTGSVGNDTCNSAQTAGFYTDAFVGTGTSAATYQGNVSYDDPAGYQICWDSTSEKLNLKFYNNDAYMNFTTSTNSNLYGLIANNCGVVNGTLGSQVDVRNNIFDGSSLFSLGVSASGAFASAIEDYNDIGGVQGNSSFTFNGSSSLGAHDFLNIDPKYTNASVRNFTLQLNSPVDCPVGGTSNGTCAGLSGLTVNNNDMGAF